MEWLYYVLSIGGTLGGVWKSLSNTIQEGDLGVRLTFGKAGRDKDGKIIVLSPTRLPWVMPLVQRLDTIHIKNNTTNLPDMRITLKNKLSYTFDAFMDYDIDTAPDSIENILFKLEDWEEFITLNFKVAIQNSLYQYEATPEKMRTVGNDIKKELVKLVAGNGFIVNSCGITNLSETPTSQATRSVDYRITAAMDHLGVKTLPDCVLAAALGATPVVSPSDCLNTIEEYDEE